jgi:hypothetical protein
MVDLVKYVRLICFECRDMGLNYEKFLTKEQYTQQMSNPDRGWRCPDCKTYPCGFDDDYWEKNEGISDEAHT